MEQKSINDLNNIDWSDIKFVENWLAFLKQLDPAYAGTSSVKKISTKKLPKNKYTNTPVFESAFVPDKSVSNPQRLISFLKHIKSQGEKGIYRKELFKRRKELGFGFDSQDRLCAVIEAAMRADANVRTRYKFSQRHGQDIVWVYYNDGVKNNKKSSSSK